MTEILAGLNHGRVVRQDVTAVGDYIALLKPRVMSLVVFTGLVGMILAPTSLHPVIGLAAMLCIAIGAGASGAINMWFDADIDAGMGRTKERPIPAGRIAPGEALAFGTTLAVGSVLMMGLMVNIASALLLAITISFYIFVYTMWLKRRTPQNIVIGGAAGALPPVIGWVSAGGGIDLYPLLLFAIVFLWTPAHFWALALYTKTDYERVGVPMLPVVAGEAATRRQIVVYAVIYATATILPWALGLAGPLYGGIALILGFVFVMGAILLWLRPSIRTARHLFGLSIVSLSLIFLALLVDRYLQPATIL